MNKSVLIQKGTLNDLRAFIEEYNKTHKPKLKIDVAVYFIGLINELSSHYREDETENEYIPLDSKILKEYHSSYNKYFEFFIQYNILEKRNYSADYGKCNSYKVVKKYLFDEFEIYQIKYNRLITKFNEKGLDTIQQEKLDYCIEKRPHLMRIFDEGLTIDYKSAEKDIEHLREQKPQSFKTAKILINEFKNQTWKASFKPYNSDFRLHTNLTRSPKIIRKHIHYNDDYLIGIDIKTSQPYFFCVVLKAILSKNKKLLQDIGANMILNYSQVNQLFDLKIDRDEVIAFVQKVIDKEVDFYIAIANELDIKTDEDDKPYRMVSNFKKGNRSRSKQKEKLEPQTKKLYESKRDLAKEVVMELFYANPNSKTNEAVWFRKEYKSVHTIIKWFYDNNIKFHQLLTNIEAFVLLDNVAKQISVEHSNMPLTSIHDCLVTTSKFEDILLNKLESYIINLTTLSINIELDKY